MRYNDFNKDYLPDDENALALHCQNLDGLLREFHWVTSSTLAVLGKNTVGYAELNKIRRKVSEYLDKDEKQIHANEVPTLTI